MMFALWLTLAGAADTVRAPGVELSQLYAEARVRSPRIGAARALARAADNRVGQAARPADPSIQLAFMNYAVPGLTPMPPLGMTQLQVMQMIPTAGKLGLARRATRADASAAAERAREVEWEVRAAVAMAFYELYATERGLDVARQTLRLLQDIRATAEAMYRVGEGRQADVLRAQVEIARMVEDTVRMTTMRSTMVATLNALLDRPAQDFVGRALLPAFPDAVPPLPQLLTQADQFRGMLRAGEQQVAAATTRAALARREIWPDLTIGVQYGQRGSEMGTERMASLMVGATVPVFARSRQAGMRGEMAAMRQMAEADLAEMRAQTRSAVSRSHAELLRARSLASLYRGSVLPQAEAAAASALAAYRVGGVDFMTLLDDRMTVNAYWQELATLEGEEGKAWAELEMLLGRDLTTPNTGAGDRAPEETTR